MTTQTLNHVYPQQLEDWLKANHTAQVLDVRMPEEAQAWGTLPNAQVVPLPVLPQQFEALNPTVPTLVYCQHGVRSLHACQFLLEKGFSQLYNLVDGYSAVSGTP